MNYKAIIFDLDGTLVHTEPECVYFMIGKTFENFGITLSNMEIDRFWFYYKREDFLREKGIDVGLFWKEYNKYDTYDLRKKHLKCYDDIDVISELKQNGYKIGIVTGAPYHVISLSIEMIGEENFDAIIRSQSTSGIKPKPDKMGIDKCLEILGASKKESIYVGNGDEDILFARNAQVFDVLIDRGEHSLLEIKPSLKINSLYELRKL